MALRLKEKRFDEGSCKMADFYSSTVLQVKTG